MHIAITHKRSNKNTGIYNGSPKGPNNFDSQHNSLKKEANENNQMICDTVENLLTQQIIKHNSPANKTLNEAKLPSQEEVKNEISKPWIKKLGMKPPLTKLDELFNSREEKKLQKKTIFQEKCKKTLISNNIILSFIFKNGPNAVDYLQNSSLMSSSKLINVDNLELEMEKEKMKSVRVNSLLLKRLNMLIKKGSQKIRIMHKFKTVFDSLSEDELDINLVPNWFNFHPNNPYIRLWGMIAEFSLLFSSMYFPLVLAFELDSASKLSLMIEISLDIVIIINIFLSLLTGFYEKSNVNYNLFKIVDKIGLGSIVFKSITSMPFALIILAVDNISDPNVLYFREVSLFFKTFRFISLFKWMTLTTVSEGKEEFGKGNRSKASKKKKNFNPYKDIIIAAVVRVVVLFLLFIVITHIVACVWLYLGKHEQLTYGNSWIIKSGLQNEKTNTIYAAAFYFSLVTIFTIGYGDIIPSTINERGFLLFFLIFASIINAYFISALSSLVQQLESKPDMSKTLNLIDELNQEFSLSSKFRQELINSLETNDNYVRKNQNNFIIDLPIAARQMIYHGMYAKKIANLKYFDGVSTNEDFLRFVIPMLNYGIYKEEDSIVISGLRVENLFMLAEGKLNVDMDFNYCYFNIAKIHRYFHFGDIHMINREISSVNIKVASKKAVIFTLDRDSLKQLKLNFSEQSRKIMKISLKLYNLIEERRVLAAQCYNKFGDFENYRKDLMKKYNTQMFEEMNEEYLMNEHNTDSSFTGSSTTALTQRALMSCQLSKVNSLVNQLKSSVKDSERPSEYNSSNSSKRLLKGYLHNQTNSKQKLKETLKHTHKKENTSMFKKKTFKEETFHKSLEDQVSYKLSEKFKMKMLLKKYREDECHLSFRYSNQSIMTHIKTRVDETETCCDEVLKISPRKKLPSGILHRKVIKNENYKKIEVPTINHSSRNNQKCLIKGHICIPEIKPADAYTSSQVSQSNIHLINKSTAKGASKSDKIICSTFRTNNNSKSQPKMIQFDETLTINNRVNSEFKKPQKKVKKNEELVDMLYNQMIESSEEDNEKMLTKIVSNMYQTSKVMTVKKPTIFKQKIDESKRHKLFVKERKLRSKK